MKPATKNEACSRHGGKGGTHDPSCECCAAWTSAFYQEAKVRHLELALRNIVCATNDSAARRMAKRALKEWEP